MVKQTIDIELPRFSPIVNFTLVLEIIKLILYLRQQVPVYLSFVSLFSFPLSSSVFLPSLTPSLSFPNRPLDELYRTLKIVYIFSPSFLLIVTKFSLFLHFKATTNKEATEIPRPICNIRR